MSDRQEASETNEPRPDWGQLALVGLAIVLLAFTAVAVSAAGGVSLDGTAQDDRLDTYGSTDETSSDEGGSQQDETDEDASDTERSEDDAARKPNQQGGDEESKGQSQEPEQQDGDSEAAEGPENEAEAEPGGTDKASQSDRGQPKDPGAESPDETQPSDAQAGDTQTAEETDSEPNDDSSGDSGTDATDADSDNDTADTGDAGGSGSDAQEIGDDPTDTENIDEDAEDGHDREGDATDDAAAGEDADDTPEAQKDTNGTERETDDAQGPEGDTENPGDTEETQDTEDGADGIDEPEADGGDADDDAAAPDYTVSLAEEPTPGTTVEVTVTEDDRPVEGATVYFDNNSIGTTDADGTTNGEVPFTQSLTIKVTPPGEGAQADVFASGTTVRGLASATTAATENVTKSVEIDAEPALRIDGPAVTGEQVRLSAAVNDVPIPNGDVVVDGEKQTTTGGDGHATVTLPENTDEATLAVTRGEINAERSIDIIEFSIEVVDSLPLPGRPAEVEIKRGDDPVSGTQISVDGDVAETTDDNGIAIVDLPIASEATLSAQSDGTAVETTVDGLYRNLAIFAFMGLGALVLTGYVSKRYLGHSRTAARRIPQLLIAVVRSGSRWCISAIVRTAATLERTGDWLFRQWQTGIDTLQRGGRLLMSLPGVIADRGLAALTAVHPSRLYRAVIAVLQSLFHVSAEQVTEAARSGGGDTTTGQRQATVNETVLTLRGLWAEFVRLGGPDKSRTKTPGEIGRYAVKRGIPESSVRTIVESYRDVEYGDQRPSSERVKRVYTALRSAVDDPDEIDLDAPSTSYRDGKATHNIRKNTTAAEREISKQKESATESTGDPVDSEHADASLDNPSSNSSDRANQ
ncbi:DUF4129 domain protein [Natronomonas pharaonis DSM 2160]|uniref:DUF4129 domain protein n=1 Tax=Natronomonas pharaonis (strain ATCC 35678 / DSM 2160 / CIP 103997 / JCM 8858 / NBRC 14720 / NCIMB 2260 / Gabara) TaxID=348780 RepID=A0A1U7EYV0_NATPD|nr:DUF4129 domain-containing protein [Natronomonas pharaonis]CAI50412.1 DUF4129 domain protein [Natronomonas pharaonis DSM 2160]